MQTLAPNLITWQRNFAFIRIERKGKGPRCPHFLPSLNRRSKWVDVINVVNPEQSCLSFYFNKWNHTGTINHHKNTVVGVFLLPDLRKCPELFTVNNVLSVYFTSCSCLQRLTKKHLANQAHPIFFFFFLETPLVITESTRSPLEAKTNLRY